MISNADFLLKTETAKKLYHEHAEKMPIIDYHCHINPQEIYEDKQKGVFNGDLGYISKIDKENKKLTVVFDDVRSVEYKSDNLDELALAYAMTIHKSQGSEFPVVVIPIYRAAPMLLTRNLIYTAITRASKAVVLVGISEYLMKMIENNRTRKRYSKLEKKLRDQDEIKRG